MSTLKATDRCRSCDAPIAWGLTAKGKRLPLDPAPSENGNVAASLSDSGILDVGVPDRRQRDAMLCTGRPLYLSHFVTCPNAKEWRKS